MLTALDFAETVPRSICAKVTYDHDECLYLVAVSAELWAKRGWAGRSGLDRQSGTVGS